MVMVSRDGLITGFILGVGLMVKLKDKEKLFMMMGSNMKENGLTIKLTGKVPISMPTKQNTLATG